MGYQEICLAIGEGIGCTVLAAFLCYRSWYGLLVGVFLVPAIWRQQKKRGIKKKKDEISRQFITAMHTVSGALLAGYSIENAMRNARRDMEKVYGQDGVLVCEFRKMEHQMAMNQPLEPLLLAFARRTGIEDINHFAEIFRHAKRSGGNLAQIIRVTVTRMQEKAAILEEIENAIAAKRMEQKMMNLMLPGILLFVTVSSPEYVISLYHNLLGIVIMSICLAGYLIACSWAERITDIPV